MAGRVAHSYRSGRVFLVGDAAHAFPPSGEPAGGPSPAAVLRCCCSRHVAPPPSPPPPPPLLLLRSVCPLCKCTRGLIRAVALLLATLTRPSALLLQARSG